MASNSGETLATVAGEQKWHNELSKTGDRAHRFDYPDF